MSGWEGSDRRSRLPPNWEQLRKAQLAADNNQCQWRITAKHGGKFKCLQPATEVDHIDAKTDDHSKLQSLCSRHHLLKSGSEGGRSTQKKRADLKARFNAGRQSAHPGLIR